MSDSLPDLASAQKRALEVRRSENTGWPFYCDLFQIAAKISASGITTNGASDGTW